MPNFHQGAPLKNPFGPPPPLTFGEEPPTPALSRGLGTTINEHSPAMRSEHRRGRHLVRRAHNNNTHSRGGGGPNGFLKAPLGEN